MVYLVQYDLIRPEKDYDAVIEEIKKSPSWAAVLKSMWAVSTNESLGQLYERVAAKVDGNDRLFVVQLSRNFAAKWQGLPKDVSEWLKTASQQG